MMMMKLLKYLVLISLVLGLIVVGLGLTNPVITTTAIHASGKEPGVVRVFVGFEPAACQRHPGWCRGWRVLAGALWALRTVSPGWHPLAQELWATRAHGVSALCHEDYFPQGDLSLSDVAYDVDSQIAHTLDPPTWTGTGYEGQLHCIPPEEFRLSANFELKEREGQHHSYGSEATRQEAVREWHRLVAERRTPKGQRCKPLCEPEVLWNPPTVRGLVRCR